MAGTCLAEFISLVRTSKTTDYVKLSNKRTSNKIV